MSAEQEGRIAAREADSGQDINWLWILGLGALALVIVFIVFRAVNQSEGPTTKKPVSKEITAEKSRETGLERFNKGQIKEAIPALERAVQSAKADTGTKTALALAYTATNKPQKAEAQYEAILKDQPKDAPTLYRLGILKQQLNRPEESVALLERAVNADPKTAQFRAELAKAYGLAGHKDKALSEWQRVLKLTPPQDLYRATILAQMADIYLAQNQKEKAVSLYKDALAIDPANPYVKQQISRVGR